MLAGRSCAPRVPRRRRGGRSPASERSICTSPRRGAKPRTRPLLSIDAGGRGQARPPRQRRLRRRRRAWSRPAPPRRRTSDHAPAPAARPHVPPPPARRAGRDPRRRHRRRLRQFGRAAGAARRGRCSSACPAMTRRDRAEAHDRARARHRDGGRRDGRRPDAHVGLFQIAGVGDAARPYLAPVDLAAAVAAAVEGWRADVVLIAMSDGAWGTPGYLRDVLREAARTRAGRPGAVDLLLGR